MFLRPLPFGGRLERDARRRELLRSQAQCSAASLMCTLTGSRAFLSYTSSFEFLLENRIFYGLVAQPPSSCTPADVLWSAILSLMDLKDARNETA